MSDSSYVSFKSSSFFLSFLISSALSIIAAIVVSEGSDPASVVFDALQIAQEKKADILICDTAGRLHNKKNLMEELKKINRIEKREWPEAMQLNLIVVDCLNSTIFIIS